MKKMGCPIWFFEDTSISIILEFNTRIFKTLKGQTLEKQVETVVTALAAALALIVKLS